MTTDTNDAMPNKIVHVPARTTQGYWFAECLFNFLPSGEESGGSYQTMELLIPPEKGAGLHIHDNEEEQFYVLEGELTYWVGDQTIHMSAGSFVHIPTAGQRTVLRMEIRQQSCWQPSPPPGSRSSSKKWAN